MKQNGLTKKQFQIQMVTMAIYMLLAVYWIVSGLRSNSLFQWILGAVYLAFIAAYTVYLIIQRKRHPVEDPELDRQAVENFKTGSKGMALVLAIIAVGFMIAFGLVALLK
jgi:Ca2+/Na+ antiporter